MVALYLFGVYCLLFVMLVRVLWVGFIGVCWSYFRLRCFGMVFGGVSWCLLLLMWCCWLFDFYVC